MASFTARRQFTRGTIPGLILLGVTATLFVGTYIREVRRPKAEFVFIPPTKEQVAASTERDARYLRIVSERNRLDGVIAITRSKLEAQTAAVREEEQSLLDVQAHITDERGRIDLSAPSVRGAFNSEVRAFNTRRRALVQRDAALLSAVDDLNDTIRRRNQLTNTLDQMNKNQ